MADNETEAEITELQPPVSLIEQLAEVVGGTIYALAGQPVTHVIYLSGRSGR